MIKVMVKKCDACINGRLGFKPFNTKTLYYTALITISQSSSASYCFDISQSLSCKMRFGVYYDIIMVGRWKEYNLSFNLKLSF